MSILEQLARYLANRLGIDYEGGASGVFCGAMPEAPARAVCVCADDLRSPGDARGTGVTVTVRSDRDGAWPLETAAAVVRSLDGRRDVLLVPDGDHVHRIELEGGFAYDGYAPYNTQTYVGTFRIYWSCGTPAAP